MPDDLAVTRSLVIPAAELRERFSRSSGPGGQGVNTADSRVELTFEPGTSTSLTESQRARVLEVLGTTLVTLSVAIKKLEDELEDEVHPPLLALWLPS